MRGLGYAQECTLTGHSNWVSSVAYSPDGNHIVCGSKDRTVKIWNVHTGRLLGFRVKGRGRAAGDQRVLRVELESHG